LPIVEVLWGVFVDIGRRHCAHMELRHLLLGTFSTVLNLCLILTRQWTNRSIVERLAGIILCLNSKSLICPAVFDCVRVLNSVNAIEHLNVVIDLATDDLFCF